jgi:hypothetical protein
MGERSDILQRLLSKTTTSHSESFTESLQVMDPWICGSMHTAVRDLSMLIDIDRRWTHPLN